MTKSADSNGIEMGRARSIRGTRCEDKVIARLLLDVALGKMSRHRSVAPDPADGVRAVLRAAQEAHAAFLTTAAGREEPTLARRGSRGRGNRGRAPATPDTTPKAEEEAEEEPEEEAEEEAGPALPSYELDPLFEELRVTKGKVYDRYTMDINIMFKDIVASQIARGVPPEKMIDQSAIAIVDGQNMLTGGANSLVRSQVQEHVRDAAKCQPKGYSVVVVWTHVDMVKRLRSAQAGAKSPQALLRTLCTATSDGNLGMLNWDPKAPMYFMVLKYDEKRINDDTTTRVKKCWYNSIKEENRDHAFCELDDIFITQLKCELLQSLVPVEVVSDDRTVLKRQKVSQKVIDEIMKARHAEGELTVQVELIEIYPEMCVPEGGDGAGCRAPRRERGRRCI